MHYAIRVKLYGGRDCGNYKCVWRKVEIMNFNFVRPGVKVIERDTFISDNEVDDLVRDYISLINKNNGLSLTENDFSIGYMEFHRPQESSERYVNRANG